ncbi:putative colanic acid biosynthesis acetyltransferase [Paraglaciecola sp. 2405UD69-4]|uniref:putative colanic acid biosynthesis acetyltransferase n=1 Tax=Paraglaciecola sp. 2405UD69-4 TaxID=3391836 RepID=UPI0039C9CBA2
MKNYQNLKQFSLPTGFRGRGAFVVQLWWIVQGTLFACSPQFAYGWRRFLLRCFGAKIGCNVIIRPSVKVTYPWKLVIEDNSWIGDYVELYTLGEITIGENAVVSQKSYLCTGSHDYKSELFDIFALPIVVEAQAWVASDVFIGPGVTIGKGAVIAARSSVYKDMQAGMICKGNPAKPIKQRI